MSQSIEQWRRESRQSIERSRARRREESPHPFPAGAWEWLIAFAIAGGIALTGFLFLLLFGAGAWS